MYNTKLSIELKANGPEQNHITNMEALGILHAEYGNLIDGISRPKMILVKLEEKLNFDFKILSWNKKVFKGLMLTYMDIKSLRDPEVIRTRNQPT
jgi:cytoplasmic iron level regulating protein YaaA (DUF328/UPF0246 family)